MHGVATEVRPDNGNRIVYTYGGADAVGPTEVGYRLERIDYSFAGGAASIAAVTGA